MKRLVMLVMTFSLLTLGLAQAGHTQITSGDRAQTVEIARKGSRPSTGMTSIFSTKSSPRGWC